jgi:phosphoribosylformylglycinamidine (FGAM) synthase PurS component
LHTHESCINEISNCQLLILIIGGRFGGNYIADITKSIVNAEYIASKELNIPVFSFIKRDVFDDHRIYRKNKESNIIQKINFPSMEKQEYAIKIFEFIDEVRLAKVNNGFFPFEYSRDIEHYLRKQWAGMFFDFLSKRRLADEFQLSNRLLSNLSTSTEKLEEIVKSMYRQMDKVHANTVIENVELKSQAEKFFRDLRAYFNEQLFKKTPIKKLMTISTDQPWYKFLIETNDFVLEKDVQNANSKLLSNILVKKDTNLCISIEGSLSSSQIKQNQDYENGFRAFAQLQPEQRIKLLESYTI